MICRVSQHDERSGAEEFWVSDTSYDIDINSNENGCAPVAANVAMRLKVSTGSPKQYLSISDLAANALVHFEHAISMLLQMLLIQGRHRNLELCRPLKPCRCCSPVRIISHVV